METAADAVPGFRLRGVLDDGLALVLPAANGGSLAEAVAATAGAGIDHGRLEPRRIRFDGRGHPVLLGIGTDGPLTAAAAANGSALDTRTPAPTLRAGAAQRDLEDLARILDACRAAPRRATQPHQQPRADEPPSADPPINTDLAPSHPPSSPRDRWRHAALGLVAAALVATPLLVVLHAVLDATGPPPPH